MRTVAILINHPNLDVLMLPVIAELAARDIAADVLVTEAGLPDRLERAGVPYTRDPDFVETFLARPGEKLFLNGADLMPVHRLGILIDDLCRQQGVPSLTLEHAPFAVDWDAPFPEDWKFAADRMAMVGTEDVRHYREIGVPEERMVLTGLPQFDPLLDLRRRRRQAPPAGGLAVFGRSHSITGPNSAEGLEPTAWVAALHRMFATLAAHFPRDHFYVKPHPAEPFHRTDRLYRHSVPADLAGRITVLSSRQTNDEIFLASRGVVTFSASVMLEATLAGVPCLMFDHAGRGAAWRDDMASAGIVVAPTALTDLSAGLATVLPDFAARLRRDAALPDAFVERYAYRFDGCSAARVADVIERMMSAAGRPVVGVGR